MAKKAGDEVAAHAIKILMNSFYGVLGTPACRFHNPALANAITGQGRDLLLWSKQWFETAGFKVLYGDTDSLFVHSGSDDAAHARAQGPKLADSLNRELARYISERWRVPSRLELEFEKTYLKLFLPRMRHGMSGARNATPASWIPAKSNSLDGGGASRLDGAGEAGPARALSATVPGTVGG